MHQQRTHIISSPWQGWSPDLGWFQGPENRIVHGYGVRVQDGRLCAQDGAMGSQDLGQQVLAISPIYFESAYRALAVVDNTSGNVELWALPVATELWAKVSGAFTFQANGLPWNPPTVVEWYDDSLAAAYAVVCPGAAGGAGEELVYWNSAGGAARAHADCPNNPSAVCVHNGRLVVAEAETLRWSLVGDGLSAGSWPAGNISRPSSSGSLVKALWNTGEAFWAFTTHEAILCYDATTPQSDVGIVVERRFPGFGVAVPSAVTGMGDQVFISQPDGSLAVWTGGGWQRIETPADTFRQGYVGGSCALDYNPRSDCLWLATGQSGSYNNARTRQLHCLNVANGMWYAPMILRGGEDSNPAISVGHASVTSGVDVEYYGMGNLDADTHGHIARAVAERSYYAANSTTTSRVYLPLLAFGDSLNRKTLDFVQIIGEAQTDSGETITVGAKGLDFPGDEIWDGKDPPTAGFTTAQCDVTDGKRVNFTTPVSGRFIMLYLEWDDATTVQIDSVVLWYTKGGESYA